MLQILIVNFLSITDAISINHNGVLFMLDWCYSSSWHISRDGLALHMTILFSSWIVHPWCTKIAIIKTNHSPAPQTIAIILNPWAYLLNRFALAQFSAIEHGTSRYKLQIWTIKPKLKPYKRNIKGLPVWGRIINYQYIRAVMGQITHCSDTNDQVNNPESGIHRVTNPCT